MKNKVILVTSLSDYDISCLTVTLGIVVDRNPLWRECTTTIYFSCFRDDDNMCNKILFQLHLGKPINSANANDSALTIVILYGNRMIKY